MPFVFIANEMKLFVCEYHFNVFLIFVYTIS